MNECVKVPVHNKRMHITTNGLKNKDAGSEKGRLKMHDLKMQDWKMTDNFARNRRVWKTQDWKMTDHVN